ncbi:hypothetical protein [Synechococcus sp. PCC 7502]|nr:hypothetical protein [Synechococcus sp. PCC 7502]
MVNFWSRRRRSPSFNPCLIILKQWVINNQTVNHLKSIVLMWQSFVMFN